MSHPFRSLGRASLLGLARALRAGRVAAPFGRTTLVAQVPEDRVDRVQEGLRSLARAGMSGEHIATMLEILAEERGAQQRLSDRVELVLSPPELDRVDARDTAVVVRELFRRAESSVLIASYALDAGDKAASLFGELAERMDARPELDVTVYANVHRPHRDDREPAALVRAFATRFREDVWPGQRLPAVYYDPRSVALDRGKRAVLHAKCVVIDGRWSLITSANFTEAAHERNIEAGLVLDDRRLARRLVRQFDELVGKGALRRLRPLEATRRGGTEPQSGERC